MPKLRKYAPFLIYLGAFLTSILLSVTPACGGGQKVDLKATVKADAIGCGMQIPVSLYTQIPAAFAGPDWQAKVTALGKQVGTDLVTCAAKDVLKILLAEAGLGGGFSTSAPTPTILHLQAFVAASSSTDPGSGAAAGPAK